MTPAAFKQSLSRSVPPRTISAALAALWWAKKGDWDKAHRIVMDEHGREAAWVHAYLHRVEGDDANARYWYAQARRAASKLSLDDEWNAIVGALCAR